MVMHLLAVQRCHQLTQSSRVHTAAIVKKEPREWRQQRTEDGPQQKLPCHVA